MSHAVKVSRFFTIPVHELFGYFIDPRLLERWSAPEGMTLHVPLLEVKVGGKFRYVHNSSQGKYICDGHFRKIILNELIKTVDDKIIDPDGNLSAKDLQTEMAFAGLGSGSGVEIKVTGFQNADMAEECEKGWNQCLDKLQDLVKDSGPHQFHAEEDWNRVQGA